MPQRLHYSYLQLFINLVLLVFITTLTSDTWLPAVKTVSPHRS